MSQYHLRARDIADAPPQPREPLVFKTADLLPPAPDGNMLVDTSTEFEPTANPIAEALLAAAHPGEVEPVPAGNPDAPPVDNAHVAEGAEQFEAPAESVAPVLANVQDAISSLT